jgi:galactokinase
MTPSGKLFISDRGSTTPSTFDNKKMSKDVATAVELFRKKFKTVPTVATFAPGRVNLIGEHTDYNDGFVLPFALPYRTIIVGAKAEGTTKCTIVSNAKGTTSSATFELNEDLKKGDPEWANYVKGTAFQYLNEIPAGSAFNAVIVSNVPIGSGLSSSAALE